MDRRDTFNRVVAALHDAMLDDTHWTAASRLIEAACRTKGNALVFGERRAEDDVRIFMARFYHRGQQRTDWENEYYTVYHPLDERVLRLNRLPNARPVHVTELYTAEELKTSPAYNEALRRGESQNSLNVHLDGPEGSNIIWALSDPLERGGWGSAEVALVEGLAPHVRQYVQVRDRLVGAEALGASLGGLLDNARLGVIHLDGRGRIVAANDRAVAILRRGDALFERDGLLCAWLSAERSHLLGLLARALEGETPTGSSMTVQRRGGGPGLGLQVSPVGPWQAELSGRRVAALVLVVDPASPVPIDGRRVAALLGLKPSEGRAAALLAQGLTVRDIAAATGWRESYVRWLLMQAYREHGLSGQVDLVRLVLALEQLPGDGH